jgi:hypothetical protein
MNYLDTKIAYLAMFHFLDSYYQATKSGDVGGLLGGLSLLQDGSSADPAMWQDWLEAVKVASDGKVDANLTLE